MDGTLIATDRPLAVAIMAMGGQGGGVLADWIVALAENAGWVAQSTSVPGVAQRTGATIYYVEMIRSRVGAHPILSLLPVPGDVDVVIAAELMEAGRAIQRGLVSPDRTTLIASSHRALAVPEKAAPGDGITDPTDVLTAANGVSARFLCADMQGLADRAGSVISASLFGALAGSGALPFPRAAFEDAIRASGIAVEASLRAFGAGFAVIETPVVAVEKPSPPAAPIFGREQDRAELARAIERIAGFPQTARDMLRIGLARVVDYQDVAYGHEYLDRMEYLRPLPDAALTEAAKFVAVALAYDDVIRVADLKTRSSRFDRVRREVAARPDQLVSTVEFMHPRVDEVCGTLPRRLGALIERTPTLVRALRAVVDHGRRMRTTSVSGFLPLWLIAGMRKWRRSLLRHDREMAHVNAWLIVVRRYMTEDPALALEVLKCRRLVKGYSDTHVRGQSKFDRVIGALPLLAGRPDAADWIRRLRDAALADEEGVALDGALSTVRTLDA